MLKNRHYFGVTLKWIKLLMGQASHKVNQLLISSDSLNIKSFWPASVRSLQLSVHGPRCLHILEDLHHSTKKLLTSKTILASGLNFNVSNIKASNFAILARQKLVNYWHSVVKCLVRGAYYKNVLDPCLHENVRCLGRNSAFWKTMIISHYLCSSRMHAFRK